MKKNSQKTNLYILVMFLVLAGICFGIIRLYKTNEIEMMNKILKANEGGGISLTSSSQFFDLKGAKTGKVLIGLKKGETFYGSLIAKNHYPEPRSIHFEIRPFSVNKNEGEIFEEIKIGEVNAKVVNEDKEKNENDGDGIEVSFSDNIAKDKTFVMGGGEVREFDYTLTIPSTFKDGDYKGTINLIEDNLVLNTHTTGKIASYTYIGYGAAEEISINVSENPAVYKSEKKLPLSIKEIVKKEFNRKLKIGFGVGLLAISLFFLILSLRSKSTK